MKSTPIYILALAMGMAGSSQAAWNRLPTPGSQPVNLASQTLFQTSIHSSSPSLGNAHALVGDNVVALVEVPAGKSEAVLQLPRQMIISSIGFGNVGVTGKVSVGASKDDKSWTNVAHTDISSSQDIVSASFAGIQAKYVKVSFEASSGGKIRAFTLEGAATDADVPQRTLPKDAAPQDAKGAIEAIKNPGATVNLANGFSRIIYANPTPTNIGAENFGRGSLKFPVSTEKYRTIIYDLAHLRLIKQFEASYAQRRVRLEVFAFDELPENKDWRGKLTFDPKTLEQSKPAAVAEDPRGIGHVRINLGNAVTARYVALRFEPNYTRSVASNLNDGNEIIFSPEDGVPAPSFLDGFFEGFSAGQFVAGDSGGWDLHIGLNGLTGVAQHGNNGGHSTSHSVTNADGSTTTTTTTTFPDGSTAETTTTTQPNGNSTTTGTITDANGNKTTFQTSTTMNADGSSTTTGSYTDSKGNTTTFVTTVQPDGSSTTTTTDPSGHTTTTTTAAANSPGNSNPNPGGNPNLVPTTNYGGNSNNGGNNNTGNNNNNNNNGNGGGGGGGGGTNNGSGGATVTIPPPASP